MSDNIYHVPDFEKNLEKRLHKFNAKDQEYIKRFNLNMIQSHCSGHATGNQIKEMINIIKSKKLFPIHTEHHEFFKSDAKVILVKEGEKFIVS
jgi:mRNA degradation ribonuclease J1/J2